MRLAIGTLSLLGLAVVGVAILAAVRPADGKDDTEITPAKAAKTQTDALKLARAEDVPAIEKANRVVIEEVSRPGGRKVTADGAALKGLREALVVKDTPPSGGKTAWRLTFYQGDKVIRKVWVYPYGEWGVERPAGPHWTLGSNAALAERIEKVLKEAKP